MRKPAVNIEKIIGEDKFKEYYNLGLINNTALRNYKIKWDYYNLRSYQSKYDAIFILMDKYYLSYESIYSILFRKNSVKTRGN
ncbi:MAG: hypothetical protein KJ571_07080 [Bacteroidetes bacterium]|nr:hypothetical protein [Bacteroidota bacterium]